MISKTVDRLYKRYRFRGTHVMLALSVVVGACTGLGAIGFVALIEYFNELFFGLTEEALVEAVGNLDRRYWLPVIPMLGGLLVGPIVFKFAGEARGHGVPEVMNAVARLGGIIRPRVAAAKTVASAICIGSGGSAGREGPIVQIGSALGSTIGQLFRLSGDRVKILVGCGAAAGISAVFNAPIAGVIFSLEIILGDFNVKTFSPVIISSVVASVVTRTFLGNHPAFDVPDYSLVSAWEIPLYMAMGSVLGFVGVGFTRILDFFEEIFERLRLTGWLKPALGGLLLGGVAIFYPQVLADGYETIRLTLYGQLTIKLLVVLIFLKMLATSLTLGSGNSGGIFAPSLFMGAVAGGAFGVIVHEAFPDVTATHGAYALVGMAGMVAATTHAPITALLIIFEMTSDYRIILPLMVTVVFSALVARKLFDHSIYTLKLSKRGIDLRGGKDLRILQGHRVSEVMDTKFTTIVDSTPLAQIFHIIERSNESYFVVTRRDGLLKGVVSFQDLRSLLSDHASLHDLAIAHDVVRRGTAVVHPDDTLEQAYNLVNLRDLMLIPVVERDDKKRVVGVLRREDLLAYYNRRLIESLRAD